MSTAKDLLTVANTLQAANMVGHNLKAVNKKKSSTKDIVGLGVGNILGTSFVQANAQLIDKV